MRGLGEACRALGLPVTGGNVSLYNESPLGRIAPTAQIGVVGLLDDLESLVRPQFRNEGDLVVLLGEAGPGMAGSAYERIAGIAPEDRPPSIDLAREASLQKLVIQAAEDRLLASAQDVSGGGLAVALAECAIWGGLGADLTLAVALAPAVALFGESPTRVVVTITPERWNELARLAAGMRVACRRLGTVGGDRLHIRLVGVGATGAAEERGAGVADEVDVPLTELRKAWNRALPTALGSDWAG